MTCIVTQWKNAFYEKSEMQTLDLEATVNYIEYYSLGESIDAYC